MPANVIKITSFQVFQEEIDKLKGKVAFGYFTATPDETGKNWCPDCVESAPTIEKAITNCPDGIVLLYVQVGSREEWKTSNNPFRTLPSLRLSCIPTLVQLGTPKHLTEKCSDLDSVMFLLTDQ